MFSRIGFPLTSVAGKREREAGETGNFPWEMWNSARSYKKNLDKTKKYQKKKITKKKNYTASWSFNIISFSSSSAGSLRLVHFKSTTTMSSEAVLRRSMTLHYLR